MITKRVNRIGVDAGIIMVCDLQYYKERNGVIDRKLSRVIDIPVGKYKTFWRIPKSWNGDVSGDGILNVTTGKVVVSDPCYIIGHVEGTDDFWMKWLDETDYGSKPHEGTLILDKMGGDGTYTVYLDLEEIK